MSPGDYTPGTVLLVETADEKRHTLFAHSRHGAPWWINQDGHALKWGLGGAYPTQDWQRIVRVLEVHPPAHAAVTA